MANFGTVNTNTLLTRQLIITGNQFRKGVTAPTDVTIGTTPTIDALHFDAVAELASTYLALPLDMNQTVDPTLILICSLSATQGNNDTLSMSLDYTATIQESTGSGVAKTSTGETAIQNVTTANGLAIGDIYTIEFPLDAGDATNPLASAIGIALEIHMTNIMQVTEFDLLGACLSYEAKY